MSQVCLQPHWLRIWNETAGTKGQKDKSLLVSPLSAVLLSASMSRMNQKPTEMQQVFSRPLLFRTVAEEKAASGHQRSRSKKLVAAEFHCWGTRPTVETPKSLGLKPPQ